MDLLKLESERISIVCFPGRLFASNVYLMALDDRAVAVDGGMPWTANRVLDFLNKNRLRLEYILLTHSHFDHVMGVKRLKERTEAKVVAHTRSRWGDVKVDDGDIVKAVDSELRFLVEYTGEHKIDHVWYYEISSKALFIGDYLPTMKALGDLRQRHGAEPKILLPGHGRPTPRAR